jgi:2-polyprenyl-3-methyl-5-hydroxy-6-metoxy-1,4-benzoquinol methylase
MNTRQYARDWGSSPSRNQAIIAGFSPSERVLYLLSKNPGTVAATSRYVEPTTQWDGGNALTELRGAFPDLDAIVRGKRILDYGCGDGFQSVALAQQGASFVMGIDIAAQRVEHGKRLAGAMTNVTFGTRADGMFDVAISLNSFEHFPQPEESLRELARAMLPGKY